MYEVIKSKQNQKVKFLYKLKTKKWRDKTRHFLVEGENSVTETVKLGFCEELFLTEDFYSNYRQKITKILKGQNVTLLAADVMQHISSTKTPQGIACVSKFLSYDLSNITDRPLVVYLDKVRKPGNLGTLVRTAHAANAAVVLSPGCVDIYNPKAVRASMASVFSVPFMTDVSFPQFKEMAEGCLFIGLDAGADDIIYDLDLKQKTVFVIGSETNGLSDDIRTEINGTASIPMPGNAESLNLAVAGSIALFEILRRKSESEPLD